MAQQAKLSDETLRGYLAHGFSQADIARMCSMSEAAVSKRVKALDRKAAAMTAPPAVESALASVWDIRTTLERCRLEAETALIESATPFERVAVINSIVAQAKFALTALQTLYSVEENAAFQEEVLAVLEEFEPGTREKVLARLREKRPLRAAAYGGGR